MSQQQPKGKPIDKAQGRPDTPRIHAQLAEIMTAAEAVGKERRNSGQGFNYRGIEDIMDALHPIFAQHKVFILSEVLDERTEERATMKGGTLIYRVLKVKVSFVSGEDGSRESVLVVGEGMDSGDKAANKAMSAALKYALTQTLILPYGQVDGDAETPPPSTSKKAEPTTSAAAPAQSGSGDALQQKLLEQMAADGISNIEMVRYCQRKGFLQADAAPNDLTALPAGLLGKMLTPANWAQVKSVIEAMRTDAPPKGPPAKGDPPKAAAKPAASDPTAFNGKLYDMMALANVSEDELTGYLRGRGLMTATQSLHNLSEKFVDVMLNGTDKGTGKNNWDLITENIHTTRKARA